MNPADETVIELSKNKILLTILGSIGFVGLGTWLMFCHITVWHLPLIVIHLAGFISVVFFGACGIYGFKKLFDKKPGLIFNSSGIVDNSSGVAAGFIPWSEVIRAEVSELNKQKMLIIFVQNPQKFINQGGMMKQLLNNANYKMCGSPIAIASNTLKINFAELLALFRQYQQKYGS